MSQTTGRPEGEQPLPALPSDRGKPKKDRTKSAPTRKRDDSSRQPEPGLFERIKIFVTQVIAEMRKVSYPNKEEMSTYFVVVIVFITALMAFTGLVDLAFDQLSTLVFG